MSFQIKSYAEDYLASDEARRAELFAEVCERLHFAHEAAVSSGQAVEVLQKLNEQYKQQNNCLTIALTTPTQAAVHPAPFIFTGSGQ